MKGIILLALIAVAGICLTAAAPAAQAQVSVNIGVAPDCPYGYYDVPPYACAPYGYYGPEWFTGGVFIGAGPWFHGPADFHGHVNNHSIPTMGIMARLLTLAINLNPPTTWTRFLTLREMKCGTGAGTS
jgi:hypothetical protein